MPTWGPREAATCWPMSWGPRVPPSYLLMPFRPMTSFSFLHASTRDTSSSWSLGAGEGADLACLGPGWALNVPSHCMSLAPQGPRAYTRCPGAAGLC